MMPFTWGLNPMHMQMQLLQQQRLANGQMNPQMVQPSFSTVMSQLPAPTNPILLPLLPATSGAGSNSLQQLQLPRRVGISVSQQPQRKFTIGGPTEAVDVLTCKVKLEGETAHLREPVHLALRLVYASDGGDAAAKTPDNIARRRPLLVLAGKAASGATSAAPAVGQSASADAAGPAAVSVGPAPADQSNPALASASSIPTTTAAAVSSSGIVISGPSLVLSRERPEVEIQYRITELSRHHGHDRFKLHITPFTREHNLISGLGPITTHATEVVRAPAAERLGSVVRSLTQQQQARQREEASDADGVENRATASAASFTGGNSSSGGGRSRSNTMASAATPATLIFSSPLQLPTPPTASATATAAAAAAAAAAAGFGGSSSSSSHFKRPRTSSDASHFSHYSGLSQLSHASRITADVNADGDGDGDDGVGGGVGDVGIGRRDRSRGAGTLLDEAVQSGGGCQLTFEDGDEHRRDQAYAYSTPAHTTSSLRPFGLGAGALGVGSKRPRTRSKNAAIVDLLPSYASSASSSALASSTVPASAMGKWSDKQLLIHLCGQMQRLHERINSQDVMMVGLQDQLVDIEVALNDSGVITRTARRMANVDDDFLDDGDDSGNDDDGESEAAQAGRGDEATEDQHRRGADTDAGHGGAELPSDQAGRSPNLKQGGDEDDGNDDGAARDIVAVGFTAASSPAPLAAEAMPTAAAAASTSDGVGDSGIALEADFRIPPTTSSSSSSQPPPSVFSPLHQDASAGVPVSVDNASAGAGGTASTVAAHSKASQVHRDGRSRDRSPSVAEQDAAAALAGTLPFTSLTTADTAAAAPIDIVPVTATESALTDGGNADLVGEIESGIA